MSQENVEAVRAIYECWGRGDFRATADKVATDFEWKQVHGVVEPGSHVGADASRALRSSAASVATSRPRIALRQSAIRRVV